MAEKQVKAVFVQYTYRKNKKTGKVEVYKDPGSIEKVPLSAKYWKEYRKDLEENRKAGKTHIGKSTLVTDEKGFKKFTYRDPQTNKIKYTYERERV